MATKGNRTPQPKQQFTCETCGCVKMQWASQVRARFFCGRPCYLEALKSRTANRAKCKVEGCGKVHKTHGYCSEHSARFIRYGDPLAGQTGHGEPLIWLLARTSHIGEDCLTWPFTRSSNGYGFVQVGEKRRRAHRVMCEAVHGPPDDPRLDAAHSCGSGHLGCVHPNHLRWATRKENVADTLTHGTRNRGERCGLSKLTTCDVKEIRALGGTMPQGRIAEKFGVSRSNIGAIISGKSWAWMEE